LIIALCLFDMWSSQMSMIKNVDIVTKLIQ
jgi:hypothetical protein